MSKDCLKFINSQERSHKHQNAPVRFKTFRTFTLVYQRGSQWKNFRQIWYWNPLRKSVEKLQMWLKSDKNLRHFTWRL